MESRVGVFVDGDNVSPAFREEILSKAALYGRFVSARVYLDARKASDWHSALGYRLVHAGCGKNASDMLLAIDSLEMRMRDSVDAVVIASSDGDFSHLAHRLNEWGTMVIGMGQAKTPAHFRSACRAFHLLGPVEPAVEAEVVNNPKPAKSAQPAARSAMDTNVIRAINEQASDKKGVLVSELSTFMRQRYGTQISTHKEKNWRAYLSARPELFDLDPKGPTARVRAKITSAA